jgi:hypothetical protein
MGGRVLVICYRRPQDHFSGCDVLLPTCSGKVVLEFDLGSIARFEQSFILGGSPSDSLFGG